MLNSMNNTDPNSQYHDFHAFTNDSCPDWYFESMTIMHWNNCIGYIGLTPQEIKSKANSGSSLGIYDGLIFDLTNYIKYPPVAITLSGTQSRGGVDTAFMSQVIVNLFTFNSSQDLMKKINAGLSLDSDTLQRQRTCLCNLFLVGAVDNINLFVIEEMVHKDFVGPGPYSTYLLLLITCIYILCNYVRGIFGTQP